MLNGTVGSNPTLSAKIMEKYSSGSRGSPAKGLGWIKPVRGFESLLLRQFLRGVAQFGSALGLGPWGRGFESLHLDQNMVGIAQLVRAPDCGSGGREFESHYPPQKNI